MRHRESGEHDHSRETDGQLDVPAQFTVTPVGAGTCTITLTDRKRNTVPVEVTVVGARIAFSSSIPLFHEIWLMDPDGQNPVRLTNNTAEDTHPAWH